MGECKWKRMEEKKKPGTQEACPAFLLALFLKEEAKAQLNGPRAGLFAGLIGLGNAKGFEVIDAGRRSVRIDVVEKIGELHVELHAHALGEMKLLGKGHGEHLRARAFEDADAAIAEAADVIGRDGEGAGICEGRSADAVWPLRGSDAADEHAGSGRIGAAERGSEERTGLGELDGGDAPAGDEHVGETGSARSELFARAERQIVKHGGEEAIAAREDDIAGVGADIEAIESGRPVFRGKRGGRGAERI